MSNQVNTVRVHTAIASAMAILGTGQRLVSKKFNETTKQKAMERHVIIPMECVTVTESEVNSQFKPLVESALMSAAVAVLSNTIKEKGENCFELELSIFDRPRLIEAFLGGDTWYSKEELEILFAKSATFKRMESRPEFLSNAMYKARVMAYKANILKLAAKNISMPVDACDKILASLEESDLDTEFGSFAVKRLSQLRIKAEQEVVDIDGL